MKIEEILCFIYPKIYVLDNLLSLQDGESPPIINNNKKMMKDSGTIFLIDNGFELLLYILENVEDKILYDLFETNNFKQIYMEKNKIENFENVESISEYKNKILQFVDYIRGEKSVIQELKIIFEGINDERGNIINSILIEDDLNRQYNYSYDKFYNKIIFGLDK